MVIPLLRLYIHICVLDYLKQVRYHDTSSCLLPLTTISNRKLKDRIFDVLAIRNHLHIFKSFWELMFTYHFYKICDLKH